MYRVDAKVAHLDDSNVLVLGLDATKLAYMPSWQHQSHHQNL